jgi:hypothetical protein
MRIGLSFSGFPPDFGSRALTLLKQAFPQHDFVYGSDISVIYNPEEVKKVYPTGAAGVNYILSTNPPRGTIYLLIADPEFLVHELQEYLIWSGYDCLDPWAAVMVARKGGKSYVEEPDNSHYIILKSGGELRGPQWALEKCLEILSIDEIASTNLITTPLPQKTVEETQKSWFEQFISGISTPTTEKEKEEIKPITGEISLWTPSVSFPSLSTPPTPAYKAIPFRDVVPILGIALLILLGIALYAAHS